MKRWIATAVFGAGAAMAAWAQNTPLHAKVSVNWPSPGVTVTDALRELGAMANVEFAFDSALVESLASVTLEMDEAAAGRIAMRILRPRGLALENADGTRPRVVRDDPYREFNIQREEAFAFARPPTLTRRGDEVTIAFETQGWSDVTVAIEGPEGRIVRHLASGVLGMNAPKPFVWNSKAQSVVWDGKDDAGVYVDNKEALTVRVSLGLKPRFERTLFWHPGKMAGSTVALAPSAEGILVFTGRGFDHVRLFDRDGNYAKTVYPFPADKLESVSGITWHELPDGHRIPIKPNYYQSTFLESGQNAENLRYRDGRYQGWGNQGTFFGTAGEALAVSGDRLAVIGHRFSRFTTQGGGIRGVGVHGPETALALCKPWTGHHLETPAQGSPLRTRSRPKRAAISPDGRWLYLTAYHEGPVGSRGRVFWHQQFRVMRVPFAGDKPPEVFAADYDGGDGPGRFAMPADVACDSKGRVYVADHMNDRIQVFDAKGQFVRSVAAKRPSRVMLHHETDEIFVFSWGLPLHMQGGGGRGRPAHVNSTLSAYDRYQLTHFSALDDGAREQASWDLQSVTGWRDTRANLEHDAIVDTRSDPIRVWAYAPSPVGARRPAGRGLVVLAQKDGEWTVKRDLRDEAARALVRLNPPERFRQRLYVNPAEDGIVYVAEPSGGTDVGMGFKNFLRVDVATGRCRMVELPMTVEDMAFSPDGFAYLKLRDMVVRYDPATWREVPFDYGEERRNAGAGVHGGSRSANVISGAVFPGGGRHHGGLHVSASGHIAVSTVYGVGPESRTDGAQVHVEDGMYRTRLYPGRRFGGHGVIQVHVLDRHGRQVRVDSVPGLIENAYGTGIDERGDIYLLEASARRIGGEMYFNDLTGTVMKFTPGRARAFTTSGAPIPLTSPPDRPLDLQSSWVEGAHWFYGGVGWSGFNATSGPQCHCPNPRFKIDYFARSFTPEHHRFNVGVLDANGNLILRVGRYGNVDEGMPTGQDGKSDPRALGIPPNPRSIGGDETALFSPRALAVDTDRRLFISDLGNARVASVKLGYHADHRTPLKDVPDTGEGVRR